MRLALVGILAIALSSSCLRFGYDQRAKLVERDAGQDAAMPTDPVTPTDAATPADASLEDASQADASLPPMDAAVLPQDSGMDAAVGGGTADASAADSGTIDAAISDAAMEPGMIVPCVDRTELPFCGDFESSAAWGSSFASNGSISTSSVHAHSGSSSLRASTTGSSSGDTIARRRAEVFDAQASGEVWARAFFYLPRSVVIDANSRLATMRLTEAQSPFAGCGVVIRSEHVELGGVTARFTTASPFPRDRWTCVELHVAIDGSAGACNAYVDGMLSTQVQGVDTLPAGGYTLLTVGLEYNNAAQGAIELYIDDVAAANSRVGCE